MAAKIFGILKSSSFISWVAIVISLGQLVINFPLLKIYYYFPIVELTPLKRDMGMPSAGSFHILNTGNDVAKDVEIGLALHPGGYIQLIPDLDHAVQCSEKVIATKSCRIKISRLPANQSVHVFIGRGKHGTDQQEDHIAMLEAIGIPSPKIEYALFGDGHMANFRGGLKNQNVILGKVQR